MMHGYDLIRAERIRQQQSENYSQSGDTGRSHELARAAAAYALNASDNLANWADGINARREWPWAEEYWKPKYPLRDLIRAGALIAAAIDSLQKEETNSE